MAQIKLVSNGGGAGDGSSSNKVYLIKNGIALYKDELRNSIYFDSGAWEQGIYQLSGCTSIVTQTNQWSNPYAAVKASRKLYINSDCEINYKWWIYVGTADLHNLTIKNLDNVWQQSVPSPDRVPHSGSINLNFEQEINIDDILLSASAQFSGNSQYIDLVWSEIKIYGDLYYYK